MTDPERTALVTTTTAASDCDPVPTIALDELHARMAQAAAANKPLLEHVPYVQLGAKQDFDRATYPGAVAKEELRALVDPGMAGKDNVLWRPSGPTLRTYELDNLLQSAHANKYSLSLGLRPDFGAFLVTGTQLLLRGTIAAAAIHQHGAGETAKAHLLALLKRELVARVAVHATDSPDDDEDRPWSGEPCDSWLTALGPCDGALPYLEGAATTDAFYAAAIEYETIGQWMENIDSGTRDWTYCMEPKPGDGPKSLDCVDMRSLYKINRHLFGFLRTTGTPPERFEKHPKTKALCRKFRPVLKQAYHAERTDDAFERWRRLEPLRRVVRTVCAVLRMHKNLEASLKRARDKDFAEAMEGLPTAADDAHTRGIFSMAWDAGYAHRSKRLCRRGADA